MQMNEYQMQARTTAIYPREHAITYPLLGLAGEVGEFANKYKKVLRDGKPFEREDMRSELGDILWYLALVADDADLNLTDIAEANITKLRRRQQAGTLGGSGDNR